MREIKPTIIPCINFSPPFTFVLIFGAIVLLLFAVGCSLVDLTAFGASEMDKALLMILVEI